MSHHWPAQSLSDRSMVGLFADQTIQLGDDLINQFSKSWLVFRPINSVGLQPTGVTNQPSPQLGGGSSWTCSSVGSCSHPSRSRLRSRMVTATRTHTNLPPLFHYQHHSTANTTCTAIPPPQHRPPSTLLAPTTMSLRSSPTAARGQAAHQRGQEELPRRRTSPPTTTPPHVSEGYVLVVDDQA